MNRPGSLLAAAAFAALAYASPAPAAPKSLYADPEPKAEAAEEDLRKPAAPTPAMRDKFRKLQEEMASDPARSADPGESAAAPTGMPREAPGPSVNVGSVALQILFGLAFVLLLAVVAIRGLKRLQGRMLTGPGRTGDILEVMETCHLGPQQKVVAIRMHDEVGIIGVTKEGMSMLTVLKEPADQIRKARGGESNSAAFSDNLNKLLDRFKKPKKVSDLLDEEPRA